MDSDPPPSPPVRARLLDDCIDLERSLLALNDATDEVPEKVRALRKRGKSLRGGLALVGLQNSAGRQIQAIGRLLSAHRDAISRRNTWNKLEWGAQPETATAIAKLLDQEAERDRPPPETAAWCAARAAEARSILDDQDEDTLSRKAASGAGKLRRRLKKRGRCLGSGTDRDFHETRKALKSYLGALGYLPDPPEPDPDLERLADLLGTENDLSTFALWLEANGFTARLVPDLWKHLRKRQAKARRKVGKCAKSAFS